jgi:hypothetical protein
MVVGFFIWLMFFFRVVNPDLMLFIALVLGFLIVLFFAALLLALWFRVAQGLAVFLLGFSIGWMLPTFVFGVGPSFGISFGQVIAYA